MFCGPQCLDTAQKLHAFECGEGFLEDLDEGSHLVLRSYWKLQLASLSLLDTTSLTTLITYKGKPEAAFWSLQDHIQHRPTDELRDMAYKAFLLMKYLALSEDALATLVTIGCKLSCNCFTVKIQESMSHGGITTQEEIRVGTGLYIFTSLFNHRYLITTIMSDFSGLSN
jgi:hypothetical protein